MAVWRRTVLQYLVVMAARSRKVPLHAAASGSCTSSGLQTVPDPDPSPCTLKGTVSLIDLSYYLVLAGNCSHNPVQIRVLKGFGYC